MVLGGVGLFAFIPLVLVLYLAQPLGTLPSLILGVVIMLGHRWIARPFSRRHRRERCLWCGRPLPLARVELRLRERGGPADYAFCPPSERTCRQRWVGLHRLGVRWAGALKLGILGPVFAYLALEFLRGAGREVVAHEVAVAAFKGIIAAVVVAVSFGYLALRPQGDPQEAPAEPFPFPLHNLTLLGAAWTLWIFRVVGLWWLLGLVWRGI
jgi:hypothetical protein